MNELTVVHGMDRWLPTTMNWAYEQIIALPPCITSQVVATGFENLDSFPFEHLHLYSDIEAIPRFFDKVRCRLFGRGAQPQLTRIIEQSGAGIVHSHFGNTGWRNLPAVRKAGVKHVASFYGYDLSQLPHSDRKWRDRYRELFDSVDRVLCLGKHTRNELLSLDCPSEKTVIHHLGADLDKFYFEPRTWASGSTLRILVCGTFREKKGIPDAIRATGLLRKSLDVELTVIGGATAEDRSKHEEAEIFRAVEESGMQAHVRFLGFQPLEVLWKEAYAHHIFLTPSVRASDGDAEGTPVTTIEMAATGMPIVSTQHSDIPEIIIDGETGWLVAERDPAALAERIHWLANNLDAWEGFATAGRRYIEAHFNSKTQAKALESIYREVAHQEENS